MHVWYATGVACLRQIIVKRENEIKGMDKIYVTDRVRFYDGCPKEDNVVIIKYPEWFKQDELFLRIRIRIWYIEYISLLCFSSHPLSYGYTLNCAILIGRSHLHLITRIGDHQRERWNDCTTMAMHLYLVLNYCSMKISPEVSFHAL